MKLKGRDISGGKAEGKVVKVEERVSFLGDADPKTGMVLGKKNISDSIFVFPGGKGSTVGSYVIYQLKKNGTAPKAMINEHTETIVATGAIISDIPLVDKVQLDLLEDGDEVVVDAGIGEVELVDIKAVDVVTSFLVKDGKVLLVKRGEDVGSFRGRWSAISGYLEEKDPFDQAMKEIREETRLEADMISKGDPVLARGGGKVWKVHPFIFKTEGEPSLDWENVEYRWVEPKKIHGMRTVPKLWEAYESARREE